MAAAREGRHGLKAFRLADVPTEVRRRVGARLIRVAEDSADPFAAIMVTRAIDSPSDRVYWIPAEAWLEQASKLSWRRAEARR